MGKWTIDQVVNGLHDLAEYVATHADLPYTLGDYSPAITFETYVYGSEDEATLPDIARKMGKCKKHTPYDGMYEVYRDFGDGAVKVSFQSPRENVCTKTKIGEKVREIPAREARTEVVPEYEYSCPESLLQKDSE